MSTVSLFPLLNNYAFTHIFDPLNMSYFSMMGVHGPVEVQYVA